MKWVFRAVNAQSKGHIAIFCELGTLLFGPYTNGKTSLQQEKGLENMLRNTLFLALAIVFVSLLIADTALAINNPPITRADTRRQINPRRRATPHFDERGRLPINYRPTLGRTWTFNGRTRNSSHYQTTNRTFHTVSGRRCLQDRAGKLIINNNRRQLIRRRSFRHRW